MTQGNRIWMIGTITAMIVIVLAGWFLGAQPFLDAANAADAQRASVEAQNAAKQAELAQLTIEKEQLPQLIKEYKALQTSIPGTSDAAAFIKGLDALATTAGVTITGITVGDPQAYTVPQSAAASAAPTDTATPSPEPAAPAVVSTAPVAVTDPLITPDNFVGILVSVDVSGPYGSVLGFVKGLQSGERLYLVTTFSSNRDAATDAGAGEDDAPVAITDGVTAHVSGYIYVLKNEVQLGK